MRSILFKLQQFPHLSETFILAQIVTAIKLGFDVKILTMELLDFKNASAELVEKYGIRDRIIHKKSRPQKNKIKRTVVALMLVVKNIFYIKELLHFLKLKKRFSLSWLYEFEYYKQFREYDIIHIQYGTNVHPIDLLKETGFLKSKIIVSFHGHDAFFPINGFIPNNGYYKYLFRNDNLVVANTPYLAEKILELGCDPENLKTIPVAVDTEFFKPENFLQKKKSPFRLLTVGRLAPVKGHHHLIQMMQDLIIKGYDDVELTIVGEGKERQKLEKLIASLGLEENISLPGAATANKVRNYYHNANVFLLASTVLSDGRRETQGLATLEAQACGLPVVVFDSGGVKYTLENGKTGFLCAENNVACLSQKVVFLMDASRYDLMSKNAVDFVKRNYAQEVIGEEWKQVYNMEK